ncbi:DUF3040 domain-containing protein [Actinomyces succiniciruminis]|uniref:DUF3040 domain-containing protein n=1 Tax=Actinomyces succiniciruminis TaxID=1522002 RepID=A0A1L7RBE7_9ACTO|nr:DUF3040 domain-containing protein [Actinomyces succiniciruminis]CED91207.1 Protein of unknown function (DUF3040) [Actinomyces succiniciruminis]
MALSEREQQVLRDLEEQLNDEDPSLAETMQHAETALRRPSPRRIGAGAALLLLGLAIVIGGVAAGSSSVVSILLGVLGFALAVWGVTLMLSRPSSKATAAGAGNAKRSSFMERQSEQWDRRRDGQN